MLPRNMLLWCKRGFTEWKRTEICRVRSLVRRRQSVVRKIACYVSIIMRYPVNGLPLTLAHTHTSKLQGTDFTKSTSEQNSLPQFCQKLFSYQKTLRLHQDTCCRKQVVSTCRRRHASCFGDKIVCCWIQSDTSRPWHKWIVIMSPRYSPQVSRTSSLYLST